MKKILLLISLLLPSLMQSQNIKDVFINMPDSMCLLLTKNNRADFADFLESNMRAQVKNKFENMSEMKTLTKDYLLLETTSASTLQMKLLPVNDSVNVICAVETYNGPASDSHISFYSTDWKDLPMSDFITLPSVDVFLQVSDTIDIEKRNLALKKADMSLIKADLSPDSQTLIFTYTTIDYLDKDSSEELCSFLKTDPVVYEWRNGHFITK
ncbi:MULTISPECIES: DUF3256 family protein [unclassified Bacteroides]|jgi:hypothetical protein|uniref:DUF3256 family protein n=1 Tax=unclassified Bacteroides TaxID=2646097 RepID=UPI000E8D1438|nr:MULTISPECIES: DUF3256 family protein [unclassified Bacteroides]RGN48136.1 DUF3256 family protein [Bacteroides sp. OM05-12]RHR76202.1 DUF3256 family protein [Bacteroides sp. AF16-49]